MLIYNGHHIGDSWYYVKDNTVFCYFLTCPNSIERHTAWDVALATSQNLVNWDVYGIVLKKGMPGQWDDTCLATGSVVEHLGRYWMAYTAKWNRPDVAIGLAVSDDLCHWRKCRWNPITRIDSRYYEAIGSGSRPLHHWRDPFLFKHDGWVYHAVCASRCDGSTDSRGTVGLARSRDMHMWEVIAPPIVEQVAQELECPQIREEDGRYILLFSSFRDLFSQTVRAELGDRNLTQSMYCMVSESLMGPYRFLRRVPVVHPDRLKQPYAGQIVCWEGSRYLLGTVWAHDNDEPDYICDPIPIACDASGYLIH